jgi:Domain of unknown function (DUF4268)
MIERIVRVPLRTVWKHEAHDFTVWLQQNIDVLTDILGFEISNPEREHSTGNFNVDIKAEDSSGNTVIIENQLGKSDHDHLGKIITYLAAFEKTVAAIWIVYEPRQEHIDAISWLNTNSNDCGFFLLKLEAIQIGKSAPAPLITKIVGPSEEAKQVGRIKQEDSMRHQLRLSFWTRLLEISKQQKHALFNSISPTKDTWIGTSAGKRGFQYSYWITKESIRAELRIDLGKDSDNENLRLFHALKKYQPEIEASFGSPLEWNEADGYRVCIVREVLTIGGYRNPEDDWDRIIHQAINAMKRLEEATKQYVMELN